MERAQRLFMKSASGSEAKSETQDGEMRVPVPRFVQASDSRQQDASGCPVVGQGQSAASGGSGCPVVGSSDATVNPLNNIPSAASLMTQQQGPETDHLGKGRVVSSIPMTQSPQQQAPPQHQGGADGGGNWVYPSEQMFYNAMQKKGWNPDANDMGAVVQIHNAVNERAWAMVREWEANAMTSCPQGPKLKRFIGRPNDYSPKARLLNFMGYKLPFDRHDWYVDRCGREVRYVIDFYNAAPAPGMPVAMHIDARPALDSPVALMERAAAAWRSMAGPAAAASSSSSSSPPSGR